MSIEDRVRKVVSEQLDVSGEIDNNASFIDDLGADSLASLQLSNRQSTTLTQIHNIHQ